MSGMQEKMSVSPKTGIVHIPSVNKSGPGHSKGSFFYRDNDLDDGKGKHMLMVAGKENTWFEFTLKHAFLTGSADYKLQMRFQTDHDNTPLRMEVRRGNKDAPSSCTIEIPLPNTKNEWKTLDPPIKVGVPLGGPPDTFLHFSHAKPQGKGILIRDFNLIPLSADESGEYSTSWINKWMEDLQSNVKKSMVPPLDATGEKSFRQHAKRSLEAHKKVEQTNEEEAKKKCQDELFGTHKECLKAALPLFEGAIDPKLASVDFSKDNLNNNKAVKELLQCIILTHGTPPKLAGYAAKGDTQRKRLQDFMNNTELMHRVLVHGGPRGGNYGRFLETYAEIEAKRNKTKSVFPKLSLAVAMEFATPIQAFDRKNVFIDPVQRYLHYEKAYLDRELEPMFESFSIWELRMAVNSDAPDEQLAWCRRTIRNYNPNIALMDDMHWRYAWLVRTDCTYNEPVWTRSPRDYKQIVSGGGMCGPRAWLGRFACKAFGCPTWGVRQPGHAAVTRWTPGGWMTALGGGFRVSWWEDRDGLDFECETKIRAAIGDDAYFQKVALIDWLAAIVGEGQNVSYITEKLWPGLAIVQRQRLSQVQSKPRKLGEQCEILPLITEVKQRKDKPEAITAGPGGSVIVPAACRSAKEGTVSFWKSFSGPGMQAFMSRPNWSVTYKLSKDKVPEKKAYKMVVQFVFLHENTDDHPLNIVITDGNGGNKREYVIPLTYTWGEWADTKPLEIVLGGADETIKIERNPVKFPFAMKKFTLTPC
ncbi:Sulfatase-modifying factor enzyme 1 [Seminavis robusta]|uniref:Sulfatase-modifying factor enzyme 1 n=1 Tax=Seminavis robusta TaxID=568900 RepID=A0A9N8EAQ9_9STRA|nr:Sulfatase-modifying factor enzyme 1 [Seminavis robusta]|eukprot:Sro816_g206650.1 Sulfatase-modifying factor enzyme 1 (757) ;mRNA; f:12969-15767